MNNFRISRVLLSLRERENISRSEMSTDVVFRPVPSRFFRTAISGAGGLPVNFRQYNLDSAAEHLIVTICRRRFKAGNRQGGVVPLNHEPVVSSGSDGSRTHTPRGSRPRRYANSRTRSKEA